MEYRAYTACIICCIFLQPYIRKKELRKSYQIEEVAPKIELSDNYIERAVDLNDYFNSSTGWDDDTDWNYAGLEDEESQKAFDKVLEKNEIYWSDQKQCWVKKVKKTAEQAPKVKFR